MDNARRVFTIFVWLLALLALYRSIRAYPESQRKERWFYASVIGTYILHVIIFFCAVIFLDIPGKDLNVWSGVVYIHGGIALLIKELVAVARVRKFDAN